MIKVFTTEEVNSTPEARKMKGILTKYGIAAVLTIVQGEVYGLIFDPRIKSDELKLLEAGLKLYVVICLWPKGNALNDLEFIDPIQRVITRQEIGSAHRAAETMAEIYEMVSIYEILPDGTTKFIDTYPKEPA